MVLNIFTLIYTITILSFIFLFYLYKKENDFIDFGLSEKKSFILLISLMIIGFFLRMLMLAGVGGYKSDMSCWICWGNQILDEGLSNFYTAPGHEWYDYPPGYMLFLGFITSIIRSFNIDQFSYTGNLFYCIPPILADMGSAYLIYKFALENTIVQVEKKGKKNNIVEKPGNGEGIGLFFAALIIFNPALFFISGAWGQIDSILTLFLLLTFKSLHKEKYIPMGIFYGLAIATKWQALISGPVLVIACLLCTNYKDKKNILKLFLSAAISVFTVFMLSLPFKGNQPVLWITSKFMSATGGYDYASIEAYNFMTMCNANWRGANETFFLGITYKAFGTIMIILVGLFTAYSFLMDYKKYKGYSKELSNRIILHETFFLFGVFTFGHYMHERYVVPVVFFAVFASLIDKNRQLLLCSCIISAVSFFNEMVALYVVSEGAIDTVRFGTGHKVASIIGGIFEVAAFIYFTIIYIKRNKTNGN